MKRIVYVSGLMILLMLVLGITSAGAQSRLEIRLRIGDQDRAMNRYYAEPGESYEMPYPAVCEMRNAGIDDEDMPIIFYIKTHSQYSLRQVYSLRARGATWEQLSNWCGVPLRFEHDRPSFHRDGPPYGNAYGYYKHHEGEHGNGHRGHRHDDD